MMMTAHLEPEDAPLWARAMTKRREHQRALQEAQAAERALAAGPRAERILNAVASRYCVTVEALRGRSRMKTLAQARAVAYWLLRQRGLSYPEIGRAVGTPERPRDHTTAIAGVRKVERMRAVSASYAAALDEIRDCVGMGPGIHKAEPAATEALTG